MVAVLNIRLLTREKDLSPATVRKVVQDLLTR